MLRRTNAARWGSAPQVYPFRKPFYDTPYDEDRHGKHIEYSPRQNKWAYPAWMDHGIDGTGKSIGLYRAHPLSKYYGTLKDNLQRDHDSVPRVFKAISQGYAHRSGRTLYTGAKLPQPTTHPWLNGEPCPVYGWRVLEHNYTTKQFDAPQVPLDKLRYKPYVALHERRIVGENEIPDTNASDKKVATKDKSVSAGGEEGKSPKTTESKPLLKRLFFWQ